MLYDGAKNLVLMLYLIHVRHTQRTPGAVAARFVFWYAAPRILINLLRDYPTHRLALGTGQTLNLVMAALGAVLLWRSRQRRLGRLHPAARPSALTPGREARPLTAQRVGFALLLAGCVLDSQQLDPGRTASLRLAPPRPGPLVALSATRLDTAAGQRPPPPR